MSSDDEELSRDRDVYVTTHTPRNTREEAATGLRYQPAHHPAATMLGTSSLTKKPLAMWDTVGPLEWESSSSPFSISQWRGWGRGHGIKKNWTFSKCCEPSA